MKIDSTVLKPHQADILQLARQSIYESKPLLIYGGRGTFKSSTLVCSLYMHLLSLSAAYHGLRYMVVAMTYRQLQEAFLDHWKEQADPINYRLNELKAEIYMNNDCIIRMRHASSAGLQSNRAASIAAQRRRGGNICGYYCPQAESLPELYHTELEILTRLDPKPITNVTIQPWIRWLDSNPDSPSHWIYRQFLASDAPRGDAIMGRYVTTPETSSYTEAQIKGFRKTWPAHRISRELDAEWIGSEGAMYSLLPDYHIRDDGPSGSCRYYLSCDFGYQIDPFVCLLIQYGDGRAHVVDECEIVAPAAKAHIAEVRQMLARNGNPEISGITGDPSGSYPTDTGRTISALRWMSIELDVLRIATYTRRKPGWQKITLWLGNETKPGTPWASMHSRCVRLAESVRSLVWDTGKDDALPGDDHHSDAWRYFLMSRAAVRKGEAVQV